MGVAPTPEFVLGTNDGVITEADGVAEPVGVETPLGPDVTEAVPLAT